MEKWLTMGSIGIGDLHLMAEKDTSNLQALLEMLRKNDYSGTFTFKVHPSHDTGNDIFKNGKWGAAA